MSRIVLGPNQYGKAECRLVRIIRDTDVHQIVDLNVTSQLRGRFEATHLSGDNSLVVATDTQKNTVYAFAREYGVRTPERFLMRLGEHFVSSFSHVTGGCWQAESYPWDRIVVDGEPHDHAFSRRGDLVRTAVVTRDGADVWVLAGLTDLTVLKSTGSEFGGFPRDRYTTLAETDDRILATSVTSRWRYAAPGGAPGSVADLDFDALFETVRRIQLETFARVHSLALQQTLYAMGEAVLTAVPEIAEIRFSMPNKHHFLVDLAPFGLDNPHEVFFAADRPYGLIEATVTRDDAPDAGAAWDAVPGFC